MATTTHNIRTAHLVRSTPYYLSIYRELARDSHVDRFEAYYAYTLIPNTLKDNESILMRDWLILIAIAPNGNVNTSPLSETHIKMEMADYSRSSRTL